MKVLITGANGIFGRKYMETFPETIPVSVRHGNVEQLTRLHDEMHTADVIIHASANLHPSSAGEAIKDNAILPFDILSMAGDVNPNTHIILISTMSLLGENGEPKKMKDMSYYASSKFIMEELCMKVSKNPVTIVRFSSLFYEDPTRDGLSKIVYTARKNCSIVASDCNRDFIPVWAGCVLLNKLLCNQKWYNRTINLVSGRSVNMIDVAHYLVKKYGVSFHHTALPDYSGICYKFNSEDTRSLEYLQYDIYKLIDQYYEKLGKELDG